MPESSRTGTQAVDASSLRGSAGRAIMPASLSNRSPFLALRAGALGPEADLLRHPQQLQGVRLVGLGRLSGDDHDLIAAV